MTSAKITGIGRLRRSRRGAAVAVLTMSAFGASLLRPGAARADTPAPQGVGGPSRPVTGSVNGSLPSRRFGVIHMVPVRSRCEVGCELAVIDVGTRAEVSGSVLDVGEVEERIVAAGELARRREGTSRASRGARTRRAWVAETWRAGEIATGSVTAAPSASPTTGSRRRAARRPA
jgi:hypothetical protein